MASNRIKNYRRIGNWENFFLDSAIYSVAASLGVEYADGFTPIAAVTGDLFTYMYAHDKPCDSGVTNYIVDPRSAVDAFAAFGFGCECLTAEQIMADMPSALAKIRASVDRGVPVLAWGVGGVVTADGERYDPMGEGALIGGYEDDCLLVHLYPGAERLAPTSFGGRPGVDGDGYTAIPPGDALATTHGVFIAGERIGEPDAGETYRRAISRIPHWLTLPDTDGWTFGRAAFERWASVLLDDANWADGCGEETVWNLHCSAYCSICTSVGVGDGEGRAVGYLLGAQEACPGFDTVGRLLPHYRELKRLTQSIWDAQGGFMPPSDMMARRGFREELAGTLREMGGVCARILGEFES